jgi:hypothetical protein
MFEMEVGGLETKIIKFPEQLLVRFSDLCRKEKDRKD